MELERIYTKKCIESVERKALDCILEEAEEESKASVEKDCY